MDNTQFFTNIELAMLNEFIKRGLRKGVDFSTQHPIKNSFILDFAFSSKKIAIECDGEVWHSSPEAVKRDRFKDHILRKLGWTVIRFTGTEILEDPSRCVDKVFSIVRLGVVR